MSDLFNSFMFDLQRFTKVTLGSVQTDPASTYANSKTNGKYYFAGGWGTKSGDLIGTFSNKNSVVLDGTWSASGASTVDSKTYKYTLGSGITNIILNGTNATIKGISTATTFDSSVKLTKIQGSQITIDTLPAIKFDSDATNAFINFSLSGTTPGISSINMSKGTFTVAKIGNGFTGGLSIVNDTAEGAINASQPFMYDAKAKNFSLGGAAANVTISGEVVTKLTPFAGKEDTITVNGSEEYTYLNYSKGAYFTIGSGSVVGFNFAGQKDMLAVGAIADLSNFKFLVKDAVIKDLSLSGLTSADARLTMTDNTSAFALTSLAGSEVVSLGGVSATFGSEEGNTLFFNAAKTGATLTGAEVATTGGAVTLAGFTKATDVSLNGSAVNLNTSKYSYTYEDKNNIYLAAALSSTLTGVKGLIASKTGNATRLVLTDNLAENSVAAVTIGSDVVTLTALTAQANAADSVQNAFILNNGTVNGFMFAEGGSGAIVFKKASDASSFGLYNGDVDESIALPKITGTGTIAIGKKTIGDDPKFNLVVGKGTAVSLGDAKVDFAGLGNKEYAEVLFNEESGITTVDYAVSPTDTTGATTPDYYSKGTQIVVTGAKASDSTGGIAFFDSVDANRVAFEEGNFTLGFEDSTSTAIAITLGSADDTFYNAGPANKIYFGEESGTLTDGGNDAAYGYVSKEGKAYLTIADSNHTSITGFVFASEGDALTLPEDGLGDVTLGYVQYGATVGSNFTSPTVDGSTGTITMITAPTKKDTEAAVFELSGLEAEAVATVGSDAATFTFSDDGGSVRFNQEGTAQGFGASAGTVTMDTVAAGLMATTDTDGNGTFTINGTPVLITAVTGDDGVVYNADDQSLLGLLDGSTITAAGPITKIYAAANENGATYTFGDGTDTVSFIVDVTGADATDLSYFTLENGKPVGFTFMKVDDAIQISEDGMPAGFLFYDGVAGSASGFTAPQVYDSEGGNFAPFTVARGKENFAIEGLNTSNAAYVAFDTAKITVLEDSAEEEGVSIGFNTDGDLVSINGLDSVGAVNVKGATKAIQFGEENPKYVEITGENSGFVYTAKDSEVTISEVAAGSVIKQAADATKLTTAAGETGAGDFTFEGESSAKFSVAQTADDDGVEFGLNGMTVVGISGVDGAESVTGAFFADGGAFSLNGQEVGVVEATASTEYTFSGTSLAGLADGDAVMAPGSVTDFITAGASGTYIMGDKAYEVAGETDGVKFQFVDGGFSAIDGLDVGATVKGDFTNVSVNGDKIDIEGDSQVYLVAGDDGIAKVGGLSGDVKLNEIGYASVLGADSDGTFDMAFLGEDDATIGIEGNASIETTFTLGESGVNVEGMDVGEKITGWFQEEFSIDGKAILVANDDEITVVNGASGISIEGLTGGASVAKAVDVLSAKTEAISGSAAFTFANGTFSIEGQDDGIEFVLDGKANVVGINDLDEGAKVTGDLTGVIIDGKQPDIKVVHADGSDNTDLTYEAGVLTGIVDGDTVIRADNVTTIRSIEEGAFTFGEGGKTFKIEGDSSVDFMVTAGTVSVAAIAALAPSATVRGTFDNITVNGDLIDIVGDEEFYLVAGESGIAKVGGLSGDVMLKDIGEATQLGADGDGTFMFALGEEGADDDATLTLEGNKEIETTFTLGEDAEGTSTVIVEGMDEGEKLTGWFWEEVVVEGHAIQVLTDEQITAVNGASGVSIEGLGDGALVVKAEGVSFATTEAISGSAAFHFANGSFSVAGQDANGIVFALDGQANVTGIDNLDEDASVTGALNDLTAVNGASFSVTDADGILTIVGNAGASGIKAIAGVNGDATISNAGGATYIQTASDGTFTFGEGGQVFEVAGDSSVDFMLQAGTVSVAAIENLATSATVKGQFENITVNGDLIDVVGDNDVYLVAGPTGEGIAKVGGLSGDVTLNAIGWAYQLGADGDGTFNLALGEEGTDDDATLTLEGNKEIETTFTLGESGVDVAGMDEGEKLTAWFQEEVSVEGKKIHVLNDEQITAVYSANGISLEGLTGGAQIVEAEGVNVATTDGEGTFTFKDGREIAIAGDSQVTFQLDGKGNLVNIGDLEATATVTGNLNGLTFVEGGTSIDVRNAGGQNVNLWYSNGTLSNIVPADTIVSADGATMVAAAGNGLYQFGTGSRAQVFDVQGDSGIIGFRVIDDNRVTTITELDPGATVFGALNNLRVNNGAPIRVIGDTEFGAVAGAEGLAALTGLGGESNAVTVIEADGAKRFETVTDGVYTLLENDPYTVGGDSDGVVFGLNNDNKVSSIEDVNGYVLGSFTDTVAVNNEDVQVTSDTDGVFVYGDGAKVTALADVNAGSTVSSWGSASKVSTKGAGDFAFSTLQNFAIGSDSAVTFVMGASGVPVTGIDDITSSTIAFDSKQTNALEVDAGINAPLTNIASETIVTLTIDDAGKLVNVAGVTGSISGVENATVAVDAPSTFGAINVNGKEYDIYDADDKYNVVAQDGVTKATAVTGDATVNVESSAVETDELGTFVIGGDSFKFSDDDGNINFTTDSNKKLASVDLLNGTMEIIGVSSAGVKVGGNTVAYYDNAPATPVTITAANDSLVAVDGLDDGSTIGGDLGGAAIAMAGTSSSVTPAELTVNGDAYQLLNDADGVEIVPATTGYTSVNGLANDASLNVVPGTYVVNGQVLEVEEGDVIVGADEGTDAYIYDPTNPTIRKNTPVSEIEAAYGMPNYNNIPDDARLTPPPAGPLTAEELADALAEADTNQPMEIWTTNKDEKTAQDLDFSGDAFTKKVHLYDGPQNLTFNDDFGNMAIVEDGATGAKNITMGNGGNMAIVDGEAAIDNQVNITGGTGDDTYIVRDNVETNINMGGANGGSDMIVTFAAANARIALSNYDAASGAGIQFHERRARDVVDAINKGYITLGKEGDGQVAFESPAGKSIVDVGQTEGGTLVNLFSQNGDKQVVGFTGKAGGAVGDAASAEDQLLIGNKDGDKTGGSSLTGGIGNDTAMAGEGDVVDLGAGNNLAQLEDDSTRGSADINLSQGRTTITGMNNTLDEAHGDVLGIDLTKAVVSFDGTNLIVEGTDFYAIATDVDKAGTLSYDSADLATSADEATADIAPTYDKYTTQIIQSGDATWRSAIGAEGSVMQVEVDEDMRANYYKGENSGVTFAGYTGDVIVDLSQDWTSFIDDRVAVFDGINSVKAGAAGSNDVIKGSAENETLMAGQGYASLYGANGNNVLYGYNSDAHDDKEGFATFFVLGQANGAANIIKDFEFVTDNNYKDTQKVTADMIEVKLEDSRVLDAYLSGNDVVIDVINNTNGVTESAIIEGAKGKDFRVTEGVIAQVNDTTLTFDEYANYYFATGKNATVNVKSTLNEANVWLGTDSQLKKDFFGDIAVLDATGFTGTANLVGTNWRDNTIIAGSGDTSLWGGASNYNDVMQGGAGVDTFYYAYGNGNDTVNGAGNGDVINLAANLSDLYTEINADNVVINFTDGGKLTVNDGGADVAYVVQGDNNATYTVDRTTNTWVRKG